MTLSDWMEEFRTFLSSGKGIAIQILLALTGGGTNMYAWDNNVMDGVYFIPTATNISIETILS
jgi:hypothetical protein